MSDLIFISKRILSLKVLEPALVRLYKTKNNLFPDNDSYQYES